jgi:uncharacterized radical SAM superfamily Fe-S cluster-containing enzyme
MEGTFADFFDVIENTKFEKMIALDYDANDYDMITAIQFVSTKNPTSSDLRLALDLIDDMYPLYKSLRNEDRLGFLKDIFKMDVSYKRIHRLNSHKKLLFKGVISFNDKNQIIIKRVKRCQNSH